MSLPALRTPLLFISCLLLGAFALRAQDAGDIFDPETLFDSDLPVIFVEEIDEVIVPLTVRGPKGDYIHDMAVHDFTLYDNDIEQNIIGFDISYLPISMVICVQTSDRVEGILGDIRKTAYLFTELVLGEFGEAAVMTFDSRIKLLQDFTNDPRKLVRLSPQCASGLQQSPLQMQCIVLSACYSSAPTTTARSLSLFRNPRTMAAVSAWGKACAQHSFTT